MSKEPPDIFYKYLPPEPYVEKILSGESIRFTPPREFNDPFEFRPLVSYEDKEAAIIHYYKLGMASGNATSTDAMATAYAVVDRFRDGPVPLEELTSYDAVVNKWGVLSLSEKPDSLLMWAHYARDHKGICVGFDSACDVFRYAMRVQYSDEYPVLDFSVRSKESVSAHVEKALLSKSDCWSYESEWRSLKTLTTDFSEANLDAMHSRDRAAYMDQRGPGYYGFDRACIREIVFGLRCSDEYQRNVRRWSEGINGLRHRQARTAKRTYAVELYDV